MIQDLLLALQITAIGMGLVFGSIILFWLLMAAMVRLTSAGHPRAGAPKSPGVEQPPEAESQQGDLQESTPSENALLKRRAAVAAVAVALARQTGAAQPLVHPASSAPLKGISVAQASAWQVVQRAKSLRIFPRGRAR